MNIIISIIIAAFTIIFFPYILAFIYAFGKIVAEVFESFAEAIKNFIEFIVDGWKELFKAVFKNGGSEMD